MYGTVFMVTVGMVCLNQPVGYLGGGVNLHTSYLQWMWLCDIQSPACWTDVL